MNEYIYIVLLGGTGFNCDFPRVRAAINFAKNSNALLVISGMGLQNNQSEHQFLADCAAKKGVPRENIFEVRSDPFHRSHRDEIRYVLNALPWVAMNAPPTILFPTEGKLHAWRIKGYAKLQIPLGRTAQIICQDSGEKLTWTRRLLEVRSFLKYLWWKLGY